MGETVTSLLALLLLVVLIVLHNVFGMVLYASLSLIRCISIITTTLDPPGVKLQLDLQLGWSSKRRSYVISRNSGPSEMLLLRVKCNHYSPFAPDSGSVDILLPTIFSMAAALSYARARSNKRPPFLFHPPP